MSLLLVRRCLTALNDGAVSLAPLPLAANGGGGGEANGAGLGVSTADDVVVVTRGGGGGRGGGGHRNERTPCKLRFSLGVVVAAETCSVSSDRITTTPTTTTKTITTSTTMTTEMETALLVGQDPHATTTITITGDSKQLEKKGTTTTKKKKKKKKKPQATTASSPKFKALIVDDQAINVKLMSKVLQRLGWSSAIANDGVEAMEQLGGPKWQSHFEPRHCAFDAVFLDHNMPNMTGLDVLMTMGRLKIETPVVMLTGNVDEDLREACMREGAFRFILKPLHMKKAESVLEDLEQFIADRKGGAGSLSPGE